MPTIKDVAEKAGVSTSTVSHVINGTRYVSPELKEKVEKAMDKLNYSPHAAARSLRAQKTHTIGVVVSDITNPFFAKVVRGVESITDKQNYNVIVANTDETAEKEKNLIEELLAEERVDGLVIAPTGKNSELFKKFNYKTSVVFVDRVPKSLTNNGIQAVLSKNQRGAYKLTYHLINRGHKRIGIVIGRKDVLTSDERLRGYKEAIKEANISYDSSLVRRGEFKEKGAALATKKLLDLNDPPTAIFAINNKTTYGVLKTIRQSSYSWPSDIEIAGFDDLECQSFLNLPLTTAIQKPKKMGQKAGELIFEKLDNQGIPKYNQGSKKTNDKILRIGVNLNYNQNIKNNNYQQQTNEN